MNYTDYYLSAPNEAAALNSAQLDGFDLVVTDEEGNPQWNTAPGGGRSAFTVTRGPITGYTEGEDGEQIPTYASGFYALLRVPNELAAEITALIESRPGVQWLTEVEPGARFS